jgi:uncharacterized protein
MLQATYFLNVTFFYSNINLYFCSLNFEDVLMMTESKLKVAFGGLGNGEHEFGFEISDPFFALFENSEIQKGKASIRVSLVKNGRLMHMDINMKGQVEVECDVCLEQFDMPFSFKGKLYLKYGEADITDDEVVYVRENDNEVDLAQYIYESINLNLPYSRVHPPKADGSSGCDPKMLEKLNKHLVSGKKETETDPRWDKLKGLNN